MEIYSVNLRIKFECGKLRARESPKTDTFHAVHINFHKDWNTSWNSVWNNKVINTNMLQFCHFWVIVREKRHEAFQRLTRHLYQISIKTNSALSILAAFFAHFCSIIYIIPIKLWLFMYVKNCWVIVTHLSILKSSRYVLDAIDF